ncbi:hypothetical protein B0H16DRAFT_1898970 [Mycena metata]|uniref:Protein kinase domain-containing protein n=1 Tax=Mycena metata TaxID=1033252 RepID=A0AAD7H840_9AGAR|nr:hypothetical protein B0H16DRAFT_1898970 [Mycena metata]
MDTETHSDDGHISASSLGEPVVTSSGSGIFAGSQYFTIVGGTFNNSTNNSVNATVPRDFRMIPMGDIDLQQELVVNKNSGVVGRRRGRNCVRRVYSAEVDGRKSNVTVVVYQGNGAESDWKRDAETYMSVRHPNIIQMCGGASYGNIHATVFHGDLIPLQAFLAQQSPIMTVYLYACYSEEWSQVYDYFRSLWQRILKSWDCTMWMRTSTGRLCVDLVSSDHRFVLHPCWEAPFPEAATLLNVTDVMAIESLSLREYHKVCFLYLPQYRGVPISTFATVDLGAVISWPSGHRYEEHVEIASVSNVTVLYDGWFGEVAQNGWSRYRADDVFKIEFILWVFCYINNPDGWLSQANHVFSRLQITSNSEDYVRRENLRFTLTIGDTTGVPPPGFLFLCPRNGFRTGPTSFKWPKDPAYWSLDPEGIQALSTEEAERLGFPSFQLSTTVYGKSWDADVYAGLCKFHQGKGFDPDSQDVARHLGRPLYELSRDVNPPFASAETAYVAGLAIALEAAKSRIRELENEKLLNSQEREDSDGDGATSQQMTVVDLAGRVTQVLSENYARLNEIMAEQLSTMQTKLLESRREKGDEDSEAHNVVALEKLLSNEKATTAELTTRNEELEASLVNLHSRFDDMENSYVKLKYRKEKINDLLAEMRVMRDSHSELQSRHDALRECCATLSSDIGLDTKTREIIDSFSVLQSKHDAFERHCKDLKSAEAASQRKINELLHGGRPRVSKRGRSVWDEGKDLGQESKEEAEDEAEPYGVGTKRRRIQREGDPENRE